MWQIHLVHGLLELGFVHSTADECVFYYNKSVLLVCVDDSILLGPDGNKLKKLKELIASKFDIQEEGDRGVYLIALGFRSRSRKIEP